MSHLLAVDPGKNALYYARFVDGDLIECGACAGGSPLMSARLLAASGFLPDILVVEGQQVYVGKFKTDPNDLLPLAECVGAVKALCAGSETEIAHPLPREWKGMTKKEVFTNRIEAVLKTRPADLAVWQRDSAGIIKSLHHNTLDAVGLGYWYHGRIGVRRKT